MIAEDEMTNETTKAASDVWFVLDIEKWRKVAMCFYIARDGGVESLQKQVYIARIER